MRTHPVTTGIRPGLAVVAVAFASLALSGCATKPAPLPSVSAPVCLPLKAYDPATQKAMADQLKSLPPESPVALAMLDYLRMRDADRACLNSK